MGNACHFLNGIHSTQHIAYVGNAHKLSILAEQCLVCLKVKLSAIVHRYDPDGNTMFRRLKLPWHYVGVVLHHRDDDLVALGHHFIDKRGSNEV